MEQTNIKKIFKEIVITSSLHKEDKLMWQRFIEVARERDVKQILDVVDGKPDDLEFLTKNLRAKLSAMASDDESSWEKIEKEENEYLKAK